MTVPPGSAMSEALLSSPILRAEDGTAPLAGVPGGGEFGIDPNDDPELALVCFFLLHFSFDCKNFAF